MNAREWFYSQSFHAERPLNPPAGLCASDEREIARRAEQLAAEEFDSCRNRGHLILTCPDCNEDVKDDAQRDVITAAIWSVANPADDVARESLDKAVSRLRDSYVQTHRDLYMQAATAEVMNPTGGEDD